MKVYYKKYIKNIGNKHSKLITSLLFYYIFLLWMLSGLCCRILEADTPFDERMKGVLLCVSAKATVW